MSTSLIIRLIVRPVHSNPHGVATQPEPRSSVPVHSITTRDLVTVGTEQSAPGSKPRSLPISLSLSRIHHPSLVPQSRIRPPSKRASPTLPRISVFSLSFIIHNRFLRAASARHRLVDQTAHIPTLPLPAAMPARATRKALPTPPRTGAFTSDRFPAAPVIC